MDTIYYHLNARKVKVSGGADLVTFVPAAAPVPTQGKGEVLDFARCRQRLETKAAWRDLVETAGDPLPQQEEAPLSSPVSTRQARLSGWLELCASAAIIAVSLAAVIAFLR